MPLSAFRFMFLQLVNREARKQQTVTNIRCIPDHSLFAALNKGELDRGDNGAQFNVFDLHHSLSSCGGAQKNRFNVERVWVVVLQMSGLEMLLYRKDDDRHQKSPMRSWDMY